MTLTNTIVRQAAAPRSTATAGGGLKSLDPALARLLAASITVRARRFQRLPIAVDDKETLYIVRSGLLLVSAQLPGGRREVVCLLYPGDMFRTALAPPLADVTLSAATAAEVGRLRWSVAEDMAQADRDIARTLSRTQASMHARQMLHTASIGGLNGEARAATFLIELALRTGTKVATGTAIDMALTRTDIADYLALNADTLSRIMSRLRASGVLTLSGRRRAVVTDWPALCALSPLAEALQRSDSAA